MKSDNKVGTKEEIKAKQKGKAKIGKKETQRPGPPADTATGAANTNTNKARRRD